MLKTRKVDEMEISGIRIGNGNPLILIGGPCVIEGEDETLEIARDLKVITSALNIPFIFKASYDKANRSSINSFRGPGIKDGLRILARVKKELDIPVLSDVHSVDEMESAASVLDIIQIPAFLCRQTDLIIAAGNSGVAVNIKKGQFLSPWDVRNIIEKIESTGNRKIILTERGSSFGYNNLVVDMRSIPVMQGFGYPVIFDATHSVQLPGGAGNASSGNREFIVPLSRGAVAAGCDGIFWEIHKNPDKALCDGSNMLALNEVGNILKRLKKIQEAILNGE